MSWLAGRGWRNPLMTVPAVAAAVALTTGAVLPAPFEPSIPHDFADPTVLSVNGIYYAYSTASRYRAKTFHIPVQRSKRSLRCGIGGVEVEGTARAEQLAHPGMDLEVHRQRAEPWANRRA
jgi:hypothetical protein